MFVSFKSLTFLLLTFRIQTSTIFQSGCISPVPIPNYIDFRQGSGHPR